MKKKDCDQGENEMTGVTWGYYWNEKKKISPSCFVGGFMVPYPLIGAMGTIIPFAFLKTPLYTISWQKKIILLTAKDSNPKYAPRTNYHFLPLFYVINFDVSCVSLIDFLFFPVFKIPTGIDGVINAFSRF